VLPGSGATDYARYMRTDVLLALQRPEHVLVHRDELLFQVVHQVHELWLRLASRESTAAAARIAGGDVAGAVDLLGRTSRIIELVTDGLGLLAALAPRDFAVIRTVLGNGSGVDSPGWRAVGEAGRELAGAFDAILFSHGVDVLDIYRTSDNALFDLARALLDLDERISVWGHRHHLLVVRIIGGGAVATQGMPVDAFATLPARRLFPRLWQAGIDLTVAEPDGRGGRR